MKIAGTGNTFRIYGDDLQTYDRLPAATYKIEFHPMAGYYLTKVDNFESKEEKIYGCHNEKIEKILKSYALLDRSLGVIFSGKKGIGKSMCVQLLGEEMIKLDIPVILVTKAYIGIADFIEEIDQECLIIFDEFEKMFSTGGRSGYGQQEQNSKMESQDNLLSLFDGLSQKKKLYAITVNDIGRVNDFMLSRPGRFHYHIRFDYPTPGEIEEYLTDKLLEKYHGEIKHVIAFSNRVKLNYDSLRAIAIELNQGYTFKVAIGDLNILTTDSQRYDCKIVFGDGKSMDLKNQNLNLFDEEIQLSGWGESKYVSVTFNPAVIIEEPLRMIVPGEHIKVQTQDEEGDQADPVEVKAVIITHHKEAGINYKLAF